MVDIYREILKLQESGGEGVLVTVVEKEGSCPGRVGAKMLVFPGGRKIGTVGGGALEEIATRKALTLLKEGKCLLEKYALTEEGRVEDAVEAGMVCGGNVTLFYEYIGTGPRVYIFGAGHVGKALVYHLSKLGYYITLIDMRKEMLEDVEGANRVISGKYEEVLGDEEIPEGSFFIITTHSHVLDYVVLKRLYTSNWNPRYIGLVASPKKAEGLVKKLKEEVGDVDLSILYTPVGLDIGGATPHEIAISIISEMQAIRYGKTGHLHLRKEWSSS